MTVADFIKILSQYDPTMRIKVNTDRVAYEVFEENAFNGLELTDPIIDVSPYDIVVIDYI